MAAPNQSLPVVPNQRPTNQLAHSMAVLYGQKVVQKRHLRRNKP